MQAKTLLPKFWRRESNEEAPAKFSHMEAPVNQSSSRTPETSSAPRGEMLSYDDIYRAAGIVTPASGYGIQKIVDMLNSDRIRDLSKEVKRASVLMALDAAGASINELLQDVTQRQQALESYEAGQRRQLEEFEARKARENGQIEAEVEQLKSHYAQRMQRNREQVDREKEGLQNWQNAMQGEMQRIAEVLDLCGTPAVAAAAAGVASADARKISSRP